jgi:hypothetical protein
MAEKSYGESLFDLGVGVPGASEGIVDLIEYLKLPEIYQSYKDQDAMMPVRDALRFIPNVVSDVATFTGDILSDIPAAVVDKAEATEFYNPFSEEGQARNLERSKGFLPYIPGVDFKMNPLSDRGADFASSLISGFTGLPSISRDNPMTDTSLVDSMLTDTEATINSKYMPEFEKIAIESSNYTDNTMPAFSTFAVNNPNKTIADYKQMQDDMYKSKYEELYDSNLASNYNKDFENLLAQNSQAKFGYNLFDKDFEMSELLGTGARKFNIGNFGIINQPAKYVSDGEYFLPFMEYESPEKEALEDLTFVGDLLTGVPGLLKMISKKGARQSPNMEEVINEYLRD